MQSINDFLVSLNIPYVNEGVARFILLVVLAAIVAVAAPSALIVLTWLERKIIGRIQDRLGPNRAGPFGWFQAVADMIKMFTKEDITPTNADRLFFNIAPGLAAFSAIMIFAVIPFAPGFVGSQMNVGLLYIIAIGGLGSLAILMAGWASNNKYALLGAFRAVAMMISYEVPMVIALICVAAAAGSMSMVNIVEAQSSMWYVISMPLVFLLFFLTGLAEVGRSPFDLNEAESEIIAGFHIEYSGMKFGLLMIAEYVHMFALSFVTAVLFFGGWQIPFINVAAMSGPIGSVAGPLLGFMALIIKVFFFVFVMMWFRGTLPRFRIDHLLDIGWKFLVPMSLVLLIGVVIVAKLFSPATSLEPGPLAGLGIAGEIVALLLVNLAVAALAVLAVWIAARRSRSKAIRVVGAAEPIITVAGQ